MEFHIPPLFVVLVAAVIAPLLGEFTARYGLPVVVLELLLGIAIGPHGLGWGAPIGAVPQLALFGMAFLFFLAGLEIDLVGIRNELTFALLGWLLGFGVAVLAALLLRASGLIHAWPVLAIAISTTALGVLLPILRDSGTLATPLGRYVVAASALGELGPILAMSLMLSRHHTAPLQLVFTLIFTSAVLLVGWAAVSAKTPAVLGLLRRTMLQSSQLPIRLAVLLLVGLAILADGFGLDLALGALAAGMIIGLAVRDADAHVLHLKLDAVGFGFLVPIFFITSGMKLDIAALFGSTAGIALAAAFIVSIIVARLPLVALHVRRLGVKQAAALGLFSATTLSLIVALTEIGIARGLMTPAEGAPLIGAGMLTVILFPALGLKLARR